MANSKKRNWLSSTLVVLIILFGGAVAVGVWRYGWETVLDESLKYLIGATFTAIIIYIFSMIYKNELKKFIK